MRKIYLIWIILSLLIINLQCNQKNIVTIRIAGNVHSHLNDLITQFQKENPLIRVEIVDMRYPPGSQFVSSNRTHDAYVGYLSTANSNIDIYEIDVIWLAEFVKNGWVQPLDQYFSKDMRNNFLDGILQGTKVDNQFWALQEWVDFGMMYYRKDILNKYHRKPPDTWDDLLKFSKIAKKNKLSLLSFQGNNYEGLVCFFNEIIRSFGGSVFDSKGNVQITTPSAKKTLQFLVYLKTSGSLPKDVNKYTEESTHKDFLNGKSLFSRNWPYMYKLSHQNPWNMNDKIAVMPIPTGKDQKRHYGTTGGWMLVISKYSKNAKESWQLINFLTSEKIQNQNFLKHGLYPTRKNLFRKYVSKELPGIEKIIKNENYLSPRPIDQNYREISRILSQKIWEAMVYHDIKDINDQLNSAQKEINSILFRKSRILQKTIR